MSEPSRRKVLYCKPLPKHKMALLTFIGLLVPAYFIPGFLIRILPNNSLLVSVIAVGVIIPLMSYLIMPLLTYLFRRWLET